MATDSDQTPDQTPDQAPNENIYDADSDQPRADKALIGIAGKRLTHRRIGPLAT